MFYEQARFTRHLLKPFIGLFVQKCFHAKLLVHQMLLLFIKKSLEIYVLNPSLVVETLGGRSSLFLKYVCHCRHLELH